MEKNKSSKGGETAKQKLRQKKQKNKVRKILFVGCLGTIYKKDDVLLFSLQEWNLQNVRKQLNCVM